MAKNFVQVGNVVTLVAPSGGVVSGGFLRVGNLAVVATYSAAEGEEFEAATTGVYELPKVASAELAAGDHVYWNGDECTGNNTDPYVGIVTMAAANGDSTVNVSIAGYVAPDTIA